MRPNLQYEVVVYIYFLCKSPHPNPKTLKISIFRVPNEVRSSLFTVHGGNSVHAVCSIASFVGCTGHLLFSYGLWL